ncbi:MULTISPECIES: nitroreductase family deazaflavin-dependent oxidoreductase [unclassified Streptomyces]|uniref:nitroreductase family deazaflavin-dependent oxidoreductase n=1 Tax=unclassified Streptomyces TaxID=2593676 RepID=UPI0022507EDF|nr:MULTISPECIES: nitroreductase family deazaflavin-dependent oxidoreductase [unclassified Streptomyces]WSP58522.1 nitroreductase family deazaflavin-dependent oxidoreductase [Streptomyces sp. NBC_01241]WSU20901.1 nitroreductase family deazaflavin-dependent oxidoreductase [Streptomyces sp. NBC_01108]MCX4790288.1 nitroreductase family deazaflavin-dependent oxidoreductase [Streptomyces sp. NBC_01221]MCX4793984.1 nitroreductase family deazaflavin-dependent oxidoreductase [Streptomyces sp. NBC_01242]
MPINRRVARFNKAVANHFVGPVLSRMPGFGKVHHRGRRSGRAFTTPVKLFRRGENIVITLPYGPGSDWVKNVQAAGGCEITTRGRRIKVTDPVVFTDDGSTKMPALTRRILSRVDATQFLSLTPVAARSAATG